MDKFIKEKLLERDFFETDDNQMVKKLSETAFHVYDELEYPYGIYAFYEVVDLEDYSEEDLEKEVAGYYKNLAELREIYNSHSNQVIAEIIAEQSEHDKFVSETK